MPVCRLFIIIICILMVSTKPGKSEKVRLSQYSYAASMLYCLETLDFLANHAPLLCAEEYA